MTGSFSRGGRSNMNPFFESSPSGGGGSGGHLETLHGSFKKSTYSTPRGQSQSFLSGNTTTTTPRTPKLDRPPILDSARSLSRGGGRFSSGGGSRGGGGGDNHHYFSSAAEDHRNPKSESRSNTSSFSSSHFGRYIDDDDQSHVSYSGGSVSRPSTSSTSNARELISKFRHSTGGVGRNYVETPPSSTKSLHHLRSSSVGRTMRLQQQAQPHHHQHEDIILSYNDDVNITSTSQYAVIGLKEELKKKDQETAYLRREISEMQAKHEDNVAHVRSKHIHEMKVMKAECEEALCAMEQELSGVNRIRSDMEEENRQLKAECHAQLEEEKHRANDAMEEVKKSKEEDLERLRGMYEEHLAVTKRTAADVELQLKEEVRQLFEENERVKLAYEDYEKVLNDAVLWEKEANTYKEELDDAFDMNDKHLRRVKALENELSDAKAELERMSSHNQRLQAEKSRFEKEFDAAVRDRNDATARNEDLTKKIDEIQEERKLESRYTEALVKQRDNMNSLIESTQKEIDELKSMNMKYSDVCKEFHLLNSDPSTIREELGKIEKMKDRVDSLMRERERYNSTVKALKMDLKSMHKKNVGSETSLQDHMRYLNEKWEDNESRLKDIDKIKAELDESLLLISEHEKERDQIVKLKRELEESQQATVKLEREIMSLTSELTTLKTAEATTKRSLLELETKLVNAENERKSLNADNKSLQAELDKVNSKKNQLEIALDNMEQMKRGLKDKLESAYYDLEVSQRELKAIRHEYEMEQSKLSSKEAEIENLNEMYNQARLEQAQTIKDAQQEVAESFKTKLRAMEEKFVHRERHEEQKLRERNQELEKMMKEQKESLDQKSMAEIKRRGEFAKQKQELEILRSKERHLETHVNQLEEHISKVVSDYEAKLQQSSNQTVCSSINEETISLKKQVRELEKKLEVSTAAMKQLGKSSLIMEKENGRLQSDKNELKLKLRKLVDCAEKQLG